MSRLHLILPTKSAFDDQAEMSCSIRNRSKVTYAGCLIYMIKKNVFWRFYAFNLIYICAHIKSAKKDKGIFRFLTRFTVPNEPGYLTKYTSFCTWSSSSLSLSHHYKKHLALLFFLNMKIRSPILPL